MSANEEKTIAAMLGTKLVPGDVWYLVEQPWFESFCAYKRVDSATFAPVAKPSGPLPGSILNASLLDPNKNTGELVLSVVEGVDFSFVHSSLWEVISKQFSFDHAIPRKVVQHGLRKTEKIETHPCYLTIYYPDATGEAEKKSVEPISIYSILKDVSVQFCPLEQKVEGRLWRDSASWRLVSPSEMEMTVEVADLSDNCLLFEYQQEGKWPRAHKEEVKRAWNDFKVDDVIDAKDTEGKWYESRIVDVKDESVYVHYNGWSSKWDEWHPKTSARLAAKNTHTTGPFKAGGMTTSSHYYSMNEAVKPKVRGVVGLRNLGNTCFMNSTLQCLSNSVELTDYFHSKHYVRELNKTNPLGWGGKIAEAYAGLMEEMWGNQYSVVSPTALKHTIGEFQPRFSGYQQHDSSELLSFLLDGLHEDLNRVLKKPATESVDSKGREDAIVAKESWDRHMMRNQSVIVDKFQGQLKSKVVCPDCKRDSVTFDPFMFLSVPLPQTGTEKQQRVTLVRAAHTKIPPMVFAVNMPTVCSTRDLLKNLCTMVAGLQVDSLVMAEVYTGMLYKTFKNKEPVDRISARDDIYVFEVPQREDVEMTDAATNTDQPKPRLKLLQLVHLTTGTYSSILEKFGLPLVLALPEEKVDNMPLDHLRQTIAELISPYVPFTGDGFGRYYDIRISGEHGNEKYLSREDPNATHINMKLPITSYNSTYASENITVGIYWNEEGKRLYTPPKEIARHESAAKVAVFDEDSNGVRATLDDCLAEFTKEETLAEGDEWYCSSCKAHKRAKKQFSVYSAPNHLIIHLKRFSYNRYWRDKIGTLVDFPLEGLDMSNWLVQKTGESPIYDLYAVSNHMGGLGGGHYTAYGKNCVDNNWYNFNDSSVSPVDSPSSIKSASAYVLFYKRRMAVKT
jgi:ubiquitin carboxyl-terminal hydrolase 4/11/15